MHPVKWLDSLIKQNNQTKLSWYSPYINCGQEQLSGLQNFEWM